MSKRDHYIARLKLQLDDWKAELRKLEDLLEDAEADAGDKYQQAVEEVHAKRRTAEVKLEALRDAGEDVWEELVDEAEQAWKAFKAGVDAFRDFSDHA